MKEKSHRICALLVILLTLAVGFYTPRPSRVLAQGAYHEAPELADLVKAGKLPPVAERLPENPLVVDTVESIGQYGGVWRRGFLGPGDFNNYHRIVYDALVRYSPDGTKVEPKLASSVEPSADYATWTVKLRKGRSGRMAAPLLLTTSCSGTPTSS